MRRTAEVLAAVTALCFCVLVTATPTVNLTGTLGGDDTNETRSTASVENYNCPADCQCTPTQNTHKPMLHAKCSSLVGLKSEEQLKATLPIHSIDLSYLQLPRLAHALEKLPDVTSVDLSHNELHEIGHLGRRIKKLNLKHNRFTSAKLTKLPQHVQVLNLQHNDVTYLPLELMRLSNLQQLELSHNQINCSCETLEVRNWLQERHVYMEHPVVCSYPSEARGKSWLQIKQSDICDKEKRGAYTMVNDENELMLGDQPVEGSGDKDNDNEEELGKDFMPIDDKKPVKSHERNPNDEVEGSGDLSLMNMPLNLAELTTNKPAELRLDNAATEQVSVQSVNEDEHENDEGSGSGGGILLVPAIHISHDFDVPESEEQPDDDFDNKPVEEPTAAAPSPDIFKNNDMGIFESNDNVPVSEDPIVPVVNKDLNANVPDVVTDAPNLNLDTKSEDIQTAKVGKQDDSNATYFLLAVIGVIVLGLVMYVGVKRCKQNSNTARDAEAQRQTELLDMDKKNLGKPLHRNGGNEHIPLIGEKTKIDEAKPINGAGKKPYDANDVKDGAGQQPLLNGNGNTNGNAKETEVLPTISEPVNEQIPHQYYPITPRYPTPQSPRASKYAQHEQNNNNPEATYLPSSPKSGRYSPVYSPETGRVKIKLTETPKPKTPMLVTRSKSNAGDIITTPVIGGDYLNVQPAVHNATIANPVATNGHLSH